MAVVVGVIGATTDGNGVDAGRVAVAVASATGGTAVGVGTRTGSGEQASMMMKRMKAER